ncbi:uncharacterized protein VTP21DRAFT_8884 [Calcarisporiella thermophila]|uniref:uncharacterized protein n=1 Tax=Calcarisporiella thermophila TaxID=911321 RepID=UPI00374304D6
MGFKDKIRATYEFLKIEKYTKRRSALIPQFAQRESDFYKQHYSNGVYSVSGLPSAKYNSSKVIRCSEMYNQGIE